MKVRSSSIPRIVACPASLRPPVHDRSELEHAGRDIGRAVHESLAGMMQNGLVDIISIADEYGVSESSVGPLFHAGRKLVDPYVDAIHVVSVEEEYEASRHGITLTGHPDFIATLQGDEDYWIVWDWKSSSPSPRYEWQLKAYWALVCANYEETEEGTLVTAWLRNSMLDKTPVTSEDAEQVWERLLEARRKPNTYNPGPDTCQFCPRRHECDALAEMISQAGKSMVPRDDRDHKDLAPSDLAALYPQYKALKSHLESYKRALKSAISSHGELPLPEGGTIDLDERERQSIDLEEAWDVLCDEWNVDSAEDVLEALGPALKVSKTKLLKQVEAPHGQKGQARDELMDRLDGAGAISVSRYKQFIQNGD